MIIKKLDKKIQSRTIYGVNFLFSVTVYTQKSIWISKILKKTNGQGEYDFGSCKIRWGEYAL